MGWTLWQNFVRDYSRTLDLLVTVATERELLQKDAARGPWGRSRKSDWIWPFQERVKEGGGRRASLHFPDPPIEPRFGI